MRLKFVALEAAQVRASLDRNPKNEWAVSDKALARRRLGGVFRLAAYTTLLTKKKAIEPRGASSKTECLLVTV
ncbi:hypothetical protein [Aporhodopirellula aestuarii]|uniref:Uncharacterized protein n=1 Tax=Aporhodopirellula aestuarii TaxID=2950107 RepID=A0ABT0U3S4_9BACT|nr:hypothetical protein [Aporhodopirellula aestuarii]MCM2371554.1 hypothetical protein [Aporhodopirellula aestuarii]